MNKLMISKFGVAAIAALAFCTQAAETNVLASARRIAPRSINVVGLEDDSDNAKVAVPVDFAVKPAASPADVVFPEGKAKAQSSSHAISADAITKRAASAAASELAVNTANVKNLMLDGMVIPPSAEQAKTLEEAIRNILAQASKQVGTVSSNGIDKLTMPYQQLGDGKSSELEWRKALRLLLTPVGYNYTEDGDFVLFGLSAEVDVKHNNLAQERLTTNRTPILFTTNESEGGMELRNAIRDISVKAGITITTDYMDPADLYVPQQKVADEGKMSAEDISKAKAKAVAQQAAVKRTTFDTNGQAVEWRVVLKAILGPNGYSFIEEEGVVKIAKPAKIKEWRDAAVAAKPMVAKVIRLYHADPEQVVERVMKIKGILVHPNASLQATRKKDDSTDTVKNLNARIQTSSGQQSGMSDTTSQIFDKLVRPRTVPAIVAYDIEENIPKIEEKIKLFDIKEKQILIEAILFQLDNDNGSEGDIDGIKWAFPNLDATTFVPLYGSFNNATKIAKDVAAWTTAKPDVDGFNIGRDRHVWMRSSYLDFSATIQLIREQDNAKLLSNPVLVIGDHSEAAIQVSDILPIPQVDASSVQNLSTVVASDNVTSSINIQWNMLRTGVLMWVSPEITETGKSVRLTVHPQYVDDVKRVDLSELGGVFEDYPVYNYELKMNEMDTRATVPSGATLMFGGLIENEEKEVETKVRWLGDLPLIGWLFRSKETKTVQKNLVVMIRPTILEDDEQTGFETKALKEIDAYSANTGRDMRKRPNGPHSFQKTGENIKEYLDEKLVKPFRGEDIIKENKQRYLNDKGEPTPSKVTPVSSNVEESQDKQSFLTEGLSSPQPAATPPPVTPPPVTPAPVTPPPATPAPDTPAPVTPPPVTPAPDTSASDTTASVTSKNTQSFLTEGLAMPTAEPPSEQKPR